MMSGWGRRKCIEAAGVDAVMSEPTGDFSLLNTNH